MKFLTATALLLVIASVGLAEEQHHEVRAKETKGFSKESRSALYDGGLSNARQDKDRESNFGLLDILNLFNGGGGGVGGGNFVKGLIDCSRRIMRWIVGMSNQYLGVFRQIEAQIRRLGNIINNNNATNSEHPAEPNANDGENGDGGVGGAGTATESSSRARLTHGKSKSNKSHGSKSHGNNKSHDKGHSKSHENN